LTGGSWTRRWSGTRYSRFVVFPPREGEKYSGGCKEGGSHDRRFRQARTCFLCLFLPQMLQPLMCQRDVGQLIQWVNVVLPRTSLADIYTVFSVLDQLGM
jgi:hypothetical protein